MNNLSLRRSDVLKLVDMPARAFDAMLTRNQAPWPRRDTGRGWGEFSTEDAYRVALAHAFFRQGGGYDEAGRVIRAEFENLIEMKAAEPGDLLIGTFITETEFNIDEEAGARLRLPVIAPQPIWFTELERVKELVAENDTLIAFVAVNATAVMKRTLTKARDAKLIDDRLEELAVAVRAV